MWKEKSIYIIMTSLLKKRVVEMVYHKPTNTNNARAYKPTLTAEDCAVSVIADMLRAGVNIDLSVFVKSLLGEKDG